MFKKVFSIKVISIIVAVSSLATTTVESDTTPPNSCLRKQLDFNQKNGEIAPKYLSMILALTIGAGIRKTIANKESNEAIMSDIGLDRIDIDFTPKKLLQRAIGNQANYNNLIQQIEGNNIQMELDNEGNIWVYYEAEIDKKENNIYIVIYKDGQFVPKGKREFEEVGRRKRQNIIREKIIYGRDYAKNYIMSSVLNLYTQIKNTLLAREIMKASPHKIIDVGSNINPISKFGLLAKLKEAGLSSEVPYIGSDLDISFFDGSKYGEDFSEQMYLKIERGLGVAGDVMQLPFKSEKADCIVCADVLEHLSDPRSAIKEFFRILTPKGRLFIVVPTFYKLDEFNYEHIRQKRSTSHLQFFKEGVILNLLRDTGFEIENTYSFGYITAFPYLLWLNADYVPQNNGTVTEKENVYKEILTILKQHLSVEDCMLIDQNIRGCENLLKNDYIDLFEKSEDIRQILYISCESLKMHPNYNTRDDLQEAYRKIKIIIDRAIVDFQDLNILRTLEDFKKRFQDPSFITYNAGNSLFIQAQKAKPLELLSNVADRLFAKNILSGSI